MFIYFLKGGLPWSGLKIDMKYEKLEKVLDKKKANSLENLCEGIMLI